MSDYETIFRDALPKGMVIGHRDARSPKRDCNHEVEHWVTIGTREETEADIRLAAKNLTTLVSEDPEWSNIVSTLAHIDGERRFCREVHDLKEIRITVGLIGLPT